MKKIILQCMKNHSTQHHFLYSVTCSVCKKTWSSPPVPFSKSMEPVSNESKRIIYHNMYLHEMEKSAIKAVDEAKTHFNYCPVCKKLVCNNCFMICEDIDMCVECATELQEKGELVSS